MKKVIVILFAFLFIAGIGLASAAPNVGNLSQRGSVLVFPKIDTTLGKETYISITNDANQPVSVYCNWVTVRAFDPATDYFGLDCPIEDFPSLAKLLPPKQLPIDSLFTLTAFQPTMFAASSGQSDVADLIPITVSPFGTDNEGYLACWAVDAGGEEQIKANVLSGYAMVLGPTGGYSYPAWSFQARAGNDYQSVGTPGLIKFDGAQYDSMPSYLMFSFPTIGAPTSSTLPLFFSNIDLTLIQGKQDFTTMTVLHPVTKAVFDAWNENEVRYSGAAKCLYCYWDDTLDNIKNLAGASIFTNSYMHTQVARFRVTGKQSAVCLPLLSQWDQLHCIGEVLSSFSSPLLGIAVQNISLAPTGPALYYTSLTPVGVAQDLSATFKWAPY